MGKKAPNTKATLSFSELVMTVYFSVPTGPTWIGLVRAIGIFVILGSRAESLINFILGLSVCLSGWLSIQRKEYPLWHRMATGSTAMLFGWLLLILGVNLLLLDLHKLLIR